MRKRSFKLCAAWYGYTTIEANWAGGWVIAFAKSVKLPPTLWTILHDSGMALSCDTSFPCIFFSKNFISAITFLLKFCQAFVTVIYIVCEALPNPWVWRINPRVVDTLSFQRKMSKFPSVKIKNKNPDDPGFEHTYLQARFLVLELTVSRFPTARVTLLHVQRSS